MPQPAATTQRHLVLASMSPRRRAFLSALGLDFTPAAADLDETPLPNEAPTDLAVRLAEQKAETVAAALTNPSALVIAADTVVALNGVLLAKPADADEAREMLVALRGCDHDVITAVCVLDATTGSRHVTINETRVTMRSYTDDEIEAYIETGDPFDKAGAYAIQHPGFRPVSQLQGCISSVMGLPLHDLVELLANFDLRVETSLAPICEGHGDFACCQATCVKRV